MEKNALMGMSIAELAEKYNWSNHQREEALRMVHGFPRTGFLKNLPSKERVGKADERKRLERETTLKQWIGVLEENCNGNPYHYFSQDIKPFTDKFIEMGLTSIDSIVIPLKTVSVEMLKQIPKEDLLQMNARIIGTFSSAAIFRYMRSDDSIGNHSLTLAEVLTKGPHHRMSRRMIFKTASVLRKLDLPEEGKLFMLDDRRNAFIENIMKTENISRDTAEVIVDIAEKRGWEIYPK